MSWTPVECVGAYVPRYRLPAETVREAWGQFHGAGITQTAVPAADEDTLTMAYEAATRALAGSAIERDGVGRLFVATTTPPAEEEAMEPRLVSMLGLGAETVTRQFTGSTRAGVEALVAACSSTDAHSTRQSTLVVATDAPRGAPDSEHEHAGGAGAVATLVNSSGSARITDVAEHVEAYPGTRFRLAGSTETTGLGVTGYDRTAFIDTVTEAVRGLETDPSDADAVCLQSPNGKLPYRVAGTLGVETDAIQRGTLVHEVGDTGVANPLLGLVAALEDGAERVVLVGYGSGGGATALTVELDGVALETEGIAPEIEEIESEATVDLSYGEYLRMRGDITPGEPAGGGAYVSVPNWKRTIPQRHRLAAGRCPACGTLSFPPDGACTGCRTLVDYEEVTLSGTGTVETATTIGQGGAPPEFVEQQARSGAYVSAIVALDGPDGTETVSIPTQVVGAGAESVTIGDAVEATIRRIYTQEGVTRYGFKMRPTA